MASPGNSYYFASHRNTSNPNSKEIDLISPRQEKKLAKQASSKPPALGAESEPSVVEALPKGSKPEEFYSRPVSQLLRYNSLFSAEERYESHQKEMIAAPSPGYTDPPIGSFVLDRKVPVKIEPKVFFAAERTFLLWMHSALWLLAASLSIIAFGREDPEKLIYGATILPVAVAFICYALFQYIRRIRMLRIKSPGPYEDLVGPTVLAVILMVAIAAQFGLKLYYMFM